tara:strand:- start:372 stop:533 length:162 start_codon:yes stop_codon:yes gene_type:complete
MDYYLDGNIYKMSWMQASQELVIGTNENISRKFNVLICHVLPITIDIPKEIKE